MDTVGELHRGAVLSNVHSPNWFIPSSNYQSNFEEESVRSMAFSAYSAERLCTLTLYEEIIV